MGVFPISGLLVKSLINKNCDNTWTSNNINIKLGPVTKIDKRNRSTQKNDTASSNYDVIDIFTIYVYLQQSGSRISDTRSIFLTFSLIAVFYLTNLKTELQIFKTALIQFLWVKVLLLKTKKKDKKDVDFLVKNADISKCRKILVLKGRLSETI